MEHDWSVRMTADIGERIAWFRERATDTGGKKMSVQALADRCAELGLPLGRVTITKLERGVRQAVTPAEVMVLAAALGVAPIELLYPVGLEEQVEMLPGRMMDPLGVVRWFCGELKLDTTEAVTTLRTPSSGEQSSVGLLEYHRQLTSRLQAEESEAARAAADGSAEGAGEHARAEAKYKITAAERWREFIREPLRRTRAEMRRRGMLLPPVPPGLRVDDDEEMLAATSGPSRNE